MIIFRTMFNKDRIHLKCDCSVETFTVIFLVQHFDAKAQGWSGFYLKFDKCEKTEMELWKSRIIFIQKEIKIMLEINK